MDNDWDLQKGEWKDHNSALGQRLEDFLLRNPEWVVFGRFDRRFKCPTHYSETSDGRSRWDASCPLCKGFGVKTDFELVPCRIERDRGMIGPGDGEQRLQPGYVMQDTIIGDFPREVRPRLEDLVFTCEWPVHPSQIPRMPKKRPVRVLETYQIKQLNRHFERESVLWNTSLELYPIEEARIADLVKSAMTDLTLRKIDRTEWQQQSYW